MGPSPVRPARPPSWRWLLDPVLTRLPGHATGGHPGATSKHAAATIPVQEQPRGQDYAAEIGATRVVPHSRSYLSMVRKDFICLAAFSQLCCRQTDKSGNSSFSFLKKKPKNKPHEEKAWSEASNWCGLLSASWDHVINSERHSERFSNPQLGRDELFSAAKLYKIFSTDTI